MKAPGIILKKDGSWTHEGVEITHERTLRLFRKSIKKDPQTSRFYLEIGREKEWIEVEEAPCHVRSVDLRA